MPIPLRVPTDYAFAKLNESRRGYQHIQRLDLSAMRDISQDGLVRVTHLRPWFSNSQTYQQFKRTIHVPHVYWQRAMEGYPAIRAYARRQLKVNPDRSPSTSPRGSRHTSPTGARRHRSPRRSPPRSPTPPGPKTPRYRKGDLQMTTKLGKFNREEYRNAPLSTMMIDPSGDECDDTDVNWPLPLCNVVNKVCRNYSPTRQYMPYRPDGTEHKNYSIRVKNRRRR